MNRSYFPVIAALAIGLAGVGHGQTSDDVDVTSSVTQNVALDGAKTVVVRCFCSKRNVKVDALRSDVALEIRGNWSSVGYHGQQEKRTSIPYDWLAFKEERASDTLTLISRESRYMHHELAVLDLEIKAPPGIEVRVEPVPANELEGRRIDK